MKRDFFIYLRKTELNAAAMPFEVSIRFYEELNDFIPKRFRKKTIPHAVNLQTNVRDLVNSFGVPHTEVDLVLVNGESVHFNHPLMPGDRISVYPMFESLDIASVTKLRTRPLREARFVLDVHLGKLARLLRMYGFDSLYQNDYSDQQIIDLALEQQRIILTRDTGILKNKAVTHGYFVRSQIPCKQIKEVIRRFDLSGRIKPFSRCIKCNGTIVAVKKEDVIDQLLPRTKTFYTEFFRCNGCRKIYWEGSHFKKMMEHFTPEI